SESLNKQTAPKSDKNVFLALLVYVDHIIITGNNVSKIDKFKVFLKSKFMIQDLEKLKYFLGNEVIDTDKGWMLVGNAGISCFRKVYLRDSPTSIAAVSDFSRTNIFKIRVKTSRDCLIAFSVYRGVGTVLYEVYFARPGSNDVKRIRYMHKAHEAAKKIVERGV
ncbi:ribonuclease H-like domain-containing protein, partial [Tanacetum coccineum]